MKLQLVAVGIAVLFLLPGAIYGSTLDDSGIVPSLETTATITVSAPTVTAEGSYLTVLLPGASTSYQRVGAPILPTVQHTFTFPLGTSIIDVTCQPAGRQTERLPGKIMPARQPVPIGSPASFTMEEDQEIYRSRSLFPGRWHEHRIGGGLADGARVTVVTVTLYPVQYIPAQGQLVYASAFDLRVRYRQPQQAAASLGQNMLIVTAEQFTDALQPLRQHKENRGTSTLIETVESIAGASRGRDVPEQIKYRIKEAVEQDNVSSVLLVGGSDELPVRYTHVQLDGDNEVFASDLYYADIYTASGNFSTWDTNGNDVFGEYEWEGNTDDVDLYPDVWLGRLPAVSVAEVTTAVDKIISYEADEAYTQNWFTTMIVAGGDSFTDAYGETSGVREGELVNQNVIDVMDGFVPVKLWESNGNAYTLDNFDQAFADGAGFASFSGHGNPSVWATHALNGSRRLWIPTSSGIPGAAGGFRLSDIDALSNGDELPIVVTGACSTSKFTAQDDCFGWSFLSNPDGGAIGSFGCTALGYVYIGRYITQGLVGRMEIESFRSFAFREVNTLGELWTSTLNAYIGGRMDAGDYKTVEEWQLFGDPSMQIANRSQQAPLTPEPPEGPDSGKRRRSYEYTAVTTDPENDDVYYLFDWGDGNYSGWVGPYASGETVTASYTWEDQGDYAIRVKAKDERGELSDWSDPLPVSMPKSFERPLWLFLERLFGWMAHVFSGLLL